MKSLLFLLFIFIIAESAPCNNSSCNTSIPSAVLCDYPSQTCFVHPNVCNSLANALASPILANNWSILISTTTFQCTIQTIQDCINISIIRSYPALKTSPVFCVFSNTILQQNNILFDVIGPLQPSIITPTPHSTPCATFNFKGSNVTIKNIIFDSSACATYASINSTTLLIRNSGLALYNVLFKSVAVPIVSKGPECNNIFIDKYTSIQSPIIYPALALPLIASFSKCSGSIIAQTASFEYLVRAVNYNLNIVNLSSFVVSTLDPYYFFTPSIQPTSNCNCSSSESGISTVSIILMATLIPIGSIIFVVIFSIILHDRVIKKYQ